MTSELGVQLQRSVCPLVQVGDDRFPGEFIKQPYHSIYIFVVLLEFLPLVSLFSGFYIMFQFQIAELARRGTVRSVVGSAPGLVAYQIGPAFNFRINTR
jgi:hypothetical protein